MYSVGKTHLIMKTTGYILLFTTKKNVVTIHKTSEEHLKAVTLQFCLNNSLC